MKLTQAQTDCLTMLKLIGATVDTANTAMNFLMEEEQQNQMTDWLIERYEQKIPTTEQDILKITVMLTCEEKTIENHETLN